MVHIMVAGDHCNELRVNSLHSATNEFNCFGHFEHLSVPRNTLQLQYAYSASYVVLCSTKGDEQNSKEFYTGIMI